MNPAERNQTEFESLAAVAEAAQTKPVCLSIPELGSEILRRKYDLEIIDTIIEFWRRYEDPTDRFEKNIVVNTAATQLSLNDDVTTYTPPDDILKYGRFTGTVYSTQLNEWILEGTLGWPTVADYPTRQSAISDYIASVIGNPDVVALVIVDGLSYSDWISHGYGAEPVYVDCPTITDCGYPNIVEGGENGPGVARQLYDQDYNNRKAFTYWYKDQSTLTKRLHEDFSSVDVVGDVEDFSDICDYLQAGGWQNGKTYLQITLTGPERVAHQHKENPDLQSEVDQVAKKFENLTEVLRSQTDSFHAFMTADHGMLWRMDVGGVWRILNKEGLHNKRRRHIESPARTISVPENVGQREWWGGTAYLRLYYPYLFYGLAQDEPGTHGGYSFEESIVPLVEERSW